MPVESDLSVATSASKVCKSLPFKPLLKVRHSPAATVSPPRLSSTLPMLLLDANVSIGMLLRLTELPEGRSLICTLADAPLDIMLRWSKAAMSVSRARSVLNTSEAAHRGFVLSTSPVALSSVASIFAMTPGVSLLWWNSSI